LCRAAHRLKEKQTFLVVSSRNIILLRGQTSTLAGLLPRLDLTPCALTLGLQLVIAGTEFGDGLLSQELLKGPLLNVLSLVLLELGNELNSTLQDRALVLLAARDDLG
jgi:hypothetical protein